MDSQGKGKMRLRVQERYSNLLYRLRVREQMRLLPVEERPLGWWAYHIDLAP